MYSERDYLGWMQMCMASVLCSCTWGRHGESITAHPPSLTPPASHHQLLRINAWDAFIGPSRLIQPPPFGETMAQRHSGTQPHLHGLLTKLGTQVRLQLPNPKCSLPTTSDPMALSIALIWLGDGHSSGAVNAGVLPEACCVIRGLTEGLAKVGPI